MKVSPYLENNQRLADVITAIQVMSTYSRYTSRDIKKWQTRFGEPASSDSWEKVISAHPEFFRIREDFSEEDQENKTLVSLNWRWSMDRNYSPDLARCLTDEELKTEFALPKNKQRRLTKRPLSSQETEILINTAISLHDSAINNEQQKRWKYTLFVPAFTAILGAAAGFFGATLKQGTEKIMVIQSTQQDRKEVIKSNEQLGADAVKAPRKSQ